MVRLSDRILHYSVIVALVLSPALLGKERLQSSSLSDSDLEASEARLTLDRALEENALLREKLAIAEAASAKLTESLSIANSEAEVFRKQTGELKLRLEALGIAPSGTNNSLEQRLLSAVNDLRLVDEQRRKLLDSLTGLSETVMRFLKTAVSSDSEARMALETHLRATSEALGKPGATVVEAGAAQATLTDAMVISIKEELSLIVTNVGSRHGVKVGMPFQVIRSDQEVATVRIVDVREKIAGAVIQNLSSEKEKIQVGDRLKVAAYK
jgi:hypothetical protein